MKMKNLLSRTLDDLSKEELDKIAKRSLIPGGKTKKQILGNIKNHIERIKIYKIILELDDRTGDKKFHAIEFPRD